MQDTCDQVSVCIHVDNHSMYTWILQSMKFTYGMATRIQLRGQEQGIKISHMDMRFMYG